MSTTFNVRRPWKISVYQGRQGTTYTVRWMVDGEECRRPHQSLSLADDFRSAIITAIRKGEPFDSESGLPLSMMKKASATTCYAFFTEYTAKRWKAISGKHRSNTAEALARATIALLHDTPHGFDPVKVRTALREWAFNASPVRKDCPEDVRLILAWVGRNGSTMDAWSNPASVRAVVDALSTKLDGTPVAGSSVRRNLGILGTALDLAAELDLIGENPLKKVKKPKAKVAKAIDKRSLLNHRDAKQLFTQVKQAPRTGWKLYAFFATLYYAGLRPEEAAGLKVQDLDLPETGWGEILVHEAAPEPGSQWSDSGKPRDRRGLKGRAVGDTRPVPAHPTLVKILREYIQNPGSQHAARPPLKQGNTLFPGDRGGDLAGSVYRRAWNKARTEVLTTQQAASPMGKRVYDLRHTCLTNWLNSGVPAPKVAEWAGNSVPVLLAVYAKCIAGQDDDLKKRIEDELPPDDPE